MFDILICTLVDGFSLALCKFKVSICRPEITVDLLILWDFYVGARVGLPTARDVSDSGEKQQWPFATQEMLELA